jgi:hypothetical protein
VLRIHPFLHLWVIWVGFWVLTQYLGNLDQKKIAKSAISGMGHHRPNTVYHGFHLFPRYIPSLYFTITCRAIAERKKKISSLETWHLFVYFLG